uniref:Arogenate dehydratase/prephenate dehydratase 1ic isoform X3 n=1 Tax=Rhizophora mucronata TaxID=61149 RepID=A0A2P2L7Q7_RHIMU
MPWDICRNLQHFFGYLAAIPWIQLVHSFSLLTHHPSDLLIN